MAKRKRTKGQVLIYKTWHRAARTPLQTGGTQGPRKGQQFLYRMRHPSCYC